jgi:hypothetical protein
MKNLKSLLIACLLVLLSACYNQSGSEFITVKVKQVEQVSGYTYLLVKGKGPEYWVAVPTMEASAGETYNYQGGMLMQDFHSKELDKTFKEVIFIDALLTEAPSSALSVGQNEASSMGISNPHGSKDATPGSKTRIAKSDIYVEGCEGCISIAELYANPASYEGKTVRVRGEIAKFNPAIMKRNWAHIQDGTEHEGKFDLTLTSQESFEVGAIVTVEGVVALNMDFGYGYSYELLMEETIVVE